jgi:hypothetical protein
VGNLGKTGQTITDVIDTLRVSTVQVLSGACKQKGPCLDGKLGEPVTGRAVRRSGFFNSSPSLVLGRKLFVRCGRQIHLSRCSQAGRHHRQGQHSVATRLMRFRSRRRTARRQKRGTPGDRRRAPSHGEELVPMGRRRPAGPRHGRGRRLRRRVRGRTVHNKWCAGFRPATVGPGEAGWSRWASEPVLCSEGGRGVEGNLRARYFS